MAPRILLGGIPLGCDNIGDEAILGCVTAIVRRLAPDSRITVATADPATAGRLGVKCVPLYGFRPEAPVRDFSRIITGFDLYIWAGATGLSDYPAAALELVERAGRAGVPTVVWNVGMDSRLNPAFFRVGGKRRLLLNLISRLTRGRIDAVSRCEAAREAAARRRIAAALNPLPLVAVRDPESFAELRHCGVRNAMIGADSAILQPTGKPPIPPPPPGVRRIGVCLSAQRRLGAEEEMAALLDQFIADGGTEILFIPMNPVTDLALMEQFRQRLRHPEHAILLKNVTDPAEVQAAAADCALVISSRLHLLILAANAGTPIIGISRGSKIDNHLANFGLRSAGDVSHCDFARIRDEAAKFSTAAGRAEFQRRAEDAQRRLRLRLEEAEAQLARLLARVAKPTG